MFFHLHNKIACSHTDPCFSQSSCVMLSSTQRCTNLQGRVGITWYSCAMTLLGWMLRNLEEFPGEMWSWGKKNMPASPTVPLYTQQWEQSDFFFRNALDQLWLNSTQAVSCSWQCRKHADCFPGGIKSELKRYRRESEEIQGSSYLA